MSNDADQKPITGCSAKNWDEIILWQDHTYTEGYRSTLKMLKFHDGKFAIECCVHGTCFRLPYTKAECGHE